MKVDEDAFCRCFSREIKCNLFSYSLIFESDCTILINWMDIFVRRARLGSRRGTKIYILDAILFEIFQF